MERKISDLKKSARVFEVWDYQVSHGMLLIRSPKMLWAPGASYFETNIDILFYESEFFSLPVVMRGLEILPANPDETRALTGRLRTGAPQKQIAILSSGADRYPVVARSWTITENDWDIFESPIEFRSQKYAPRAPENGRPYSLCISSPPDRKKLVAEILFDKIQWAEVNMDNGQLHTEFYPRPDGKPWQLDHATSLAALREAGECLAARLNGSDNTP